VGTAVTSHDAAASALPASIQAAWGRPGPARRGPKPGLNLQDIVDAGLRLAASKGLAAVSMGRVAVDLGTSTMSLYRYVAAKTELLELMVDAVLGCCPAPPPGEGWRAGLERWAWTQRTVIYEHPWVLQVPLRGLPATPNQVRWLEHGLQSLAGTKLTWTEKCSAIFLLSMYVRAEASMMADIRSSLTAPGNAAGPTIADYGHVLADLTGDGDFPALAAALEAGVFGQQDPPATQFSFGLDRVLDGIDALIGQRAG
jgi:AcrR family transcriptional regulator